MAMFVVKIFLGDLRNSPLISKFYSLVVEESLCDIQTGIFLKGEQSCKS
jgi:hypothetical protein